MREDVAFRVRLAVLADCVDFDVDFCCLEALDCALCFDLPVDLDDDALLRGFFSAPSLAVVVLERARLVDLAGLDFPSARALVLRFWAGWRLDFGDFSLSDAVLRFAITSAIPT